MCIKNTSPQHQFVPFQPFHHHGREQRSVKGPQGQECRPAQSWNGLHDHQQEARTFGAIIRKWKKYQMKICCPQSGAPYKTLPHDVRSIMRIVDWPKTTQVELCMITKRCCDQMKPKFSLCHDLHAHIGIAVSLPLPQLRTQFFSLAFNLE